MLLQVLTLQQDPALRNCTKIHVRAHAHKHAASHVASPNNVRLMAVNAARQRETEIQTGRREASAGWTEGRTEGRIDDHRGKRRRGHIAPEAAGFEGGMRL